MLCLLAISWQQELTKEERKVFRINTFVEYISFTLQKKNNHTTIIINTNIQLTQSAQTKQITSTSILNLNSIS